MSCKKDPLPEPEPPSNVFKSNLYVEWYKYFYQDTSGGYFKDPNFSGDYVSFLCYDVVYGNGLPGVGIFNKQTGEKHPAWNCNPGSNFYFSGVSDWLIGGNNNNYIATLEDFNLKCYDLNTATLKWNIYSQHIMPRIGNYGNYVYYCDNVRIYADLYQMNIETGQRRKIIRINKTNGYEPSFESFSGWIAPNGDSILIFQNRQWNFPIGDGKIDIYAYNLKADTILWVLEDISSDGNSSVMRPVIADNKLFFPGLMSQHCIDLLTGQMIWEHEYTDRGFANSANLYADGTLFARSQSEIIAYNPNNGNELWSIKKKYSIQTGGNMGYYKGKLYFTAIDDSDYNIPTYLFCLNATDGSLVWKGSGVVKSGMKDGVIVDQTTGFLYANDSYRIMCIDLNKTPLTNKK